MYTITTTLCGLMLTLMAVFVSTGYGQVLPDRIRMEVLQDLYAPATFEHARHIERERDCAICHHHTNGAPAASERCIRCHLGGHEGKSMACKNCHEKEPFSAAVVNQKFKNGQQFHQDRPGLKAAYHFNCIGCHRKQGGPQGCTDCHELTERGEAFYRSGKYAPELGKTATRHH